MSGDEIWSIVGKILAFVGGIAALIKIVEWFSSPQHKLTTSVEAVPFELPERKNYSNKLSDFASMWIISVANNGKKPCDEITLVLPHAAIARISYRLGTSEEYRELTHGVINLGSLNPSDWISIRAWSPSRVTVYQLADVRISHNAGVGKIRPRATASKYLHDFEENFPLYSKLIFGSAVGVLIAFLVIYGVNWFHGFDKDKTQSGTYISTNSFPSQPNQSVQ
ncbi:MAG TPA: hypothetical protein VGI63_00405 [Verrucomicrobiae bacterium]|jgi:hypothetical protein